MIVDSAVLGKVREAPGGGLIAPARIGRTGVQVYRRPDGTAIRAYRPPEEVFAADFTGAPVTVGHPTGGVTPATWRKHAVGVIAAQAKEPVVVDGAQWAQAEVQLSDAEAIALARAGAECSCAYDCTREWTPGVTDAGEPYDVIFRALKPNHVALGPAGFARAGRDARVLISDGETMADVFTDTFFAADEADLSLAADPSKDVAALAKLIADSNAEVARLRTENETLAGKLQAAEAKVAELQTVADGVTAQVEDGVKAALAFRASMAAYLPKDFVFDGKTDREVRVAAVHALDPKFEVTDAVTDARLDGYLEAAGKFASRHDHNTSVTDAGDPAKTKLDPAKHIADSTKDLWKGTK